MRLIMITPRVGYQNEIFAFIPSWINSLAKNTEHLWILTPRSEGLSFPENVEIIEVGRNYSKHETFFHAIFHFHRAMIRILNNERVDGIFSHMYPEFAIIAAPYARIANIKQILWYAHTGVTWKLKLANILVNNIVTTSKDTCKLVSNKIVPIGQGIDTNLFNKKISVPLIEENGFKKIIYAGRISPIKNLYDFIQTARLLIYQYNRKDLRFIIAGAPPNPTQNQYLFDLINIVKELDLQDFFTFPGRIPHEELPFLFSKCHVFVSTSKSGIDKTILEAMACELPPVISNSEFKPILKEFSQTLVCAENNPVELAEKINHLLSLSPDDYYCLGKSLREIILIDHNLDIFIEKLISKY